MNFSHAIEANIKDRLKLQSFDELDRKDTNTR